MMNMSRKLAYNKKEEYLVLLSQVLFQKIVQVPTYTVGTIFIKMTKITIIRSIMIVQRYFSDEQRKAQVNK